MSRLLSNVPSLLIDLTYLSYAGLRRCRNKYSQHGSFETGTGKTCRDDEKERAVVENDRSVVVYFNLNRCTRVNLPAPWLEKQVLDRVSSQLVDEARYLSKMMLHASCSDER